MLDDLAAAGIRFRGVRELVDVAANARSSHHRRYQNRLQVGLYDPFQEGAPAAAAAASDAAELLKAAGYRTALVASGTWDSPMFGSLNSGYDDFFGSWVRDDVLHAQVGPVLGVPRYPLSTKEKRRRTEDTRPISCRPAIEVIQATIPVRLLTLLQRAACRGRAADQRKPRASAKWRTTRVDHRESSAMSRA